MSRLSQFAVSKRSVTLLLAGALFVAGLLAWGIVMSISRNSGAWRSARCCMSAS